MNTVWCMTCFISIAARLTVQLFPFNSKLLIKVFENITNCFSNCVNVNMNKKHVNLNNYTWVLLRCRMNQVWGSSSSPGASWEDSLSLSYCVHLIMCVDDSVVCCVFRSQCSGWAQKDSKTLRCPFWPLSSKVTTHLQFKGAACNMWPQFKALSETELALQCPLKLAC